MNMHFTHSGTPQAPSAAAVTTGIAGTQQLVDGDGVNRDEVSDENDSPDDVRQSFKAVPSQKRRRVTRACDECRRKKIKCDGQQPCTHCTVYSYECTYDQPSQRRRNPGPAYIEALEQKLQKAEALLKTYDSSINLNDSNLDARLAKIGKTDGQSVHRTKEPTYDPKPVPSNEEHIETMIKATGQLDLDERGQWEYYGHSSGLSWLRRIRDQFGERSGAPFDPTRSTTAQRGRHMGQDFETPLTPPGEQERLPFDNIKDKRNACLPSKEVATQLCEDALNDASAILNLVYRPGFWRSLDRIYDRSPDQYEIEDRRFLPLLYASLALGSLFGHSEAGELDEAGYHPATHIGYDYFWTARNIVDLTDCRDLMQLQAIILMIMFLQCSAKLSTCYSYIGIALRCALRMGLHRSFRDSFTPVEAETRKRCFWVIRKFDIYVGAMLGLPLTLSDDDVDQEFPQEVDDMYITDIDIKSMPIGYVPLQTASNANFKLSKILAKIVKSIYPTKGFRNDEESSPRTYSVSFGIIRQLESDLEAWKEDLPSELKPGGARQPWHPVKQPPVIQLLRLAYAHAQMMLYRPFLHYISSRNSSKVVNQRSYACAMACISISRNIIQITIEMMREGYLVGSYWFTMYTTFFAVLSLAYFVVENTESATAKELLIDATAGRKALQELSRRSMAADRCSHTLDSIFNTLPDSLLAVDGSHSISRKRSSPETSSMLHAQRMPPPAMPAQRPKAQMKATSASLAPIQSSTSRPSLFERRVASQGPKLPMPNDGISGSTSSGGSSTYSQHITQQPPAVPADLEGRQSYQLPQPQYNLGPSDPNYPANLTDLSALMFPSADPFAYPIPPMTTLEQNAAWGMEPSRPEMDRRISTISTPASGQHSHVGNAGSHDQHMSSQPSTDDYSHNSIPASTAATDTVFADDNIDVHLFGPLPGYMMRHSYMDPHHQQQQQDHMRHYNQDNGGMGPSQGGHAHTQQHQQPPHQPHQMWNQNGMNYEDIFSNDAVWRGHMP